VTSPDMADEGDRRRSLRTLWATVRPMEAARKVGTPSVEIVPARRSFVVDLGPLWEYRALLYFFTWRDLKVRYKQTLLGSSWAIIQPLITTVVFTVFLGRVAHVSSEGLPYLLFSFTGMLPWTYFQNSVTNGSNTLVQSSAIITKVYFPRIAMPIATVLGYAVDLVCAGIVLIPMMAYYGVAPSARLLVLPLFFLLATAAAVGVTLFLASLNVRFRDVKYVIPFLVQIWLFASPVVYSAQSLHQPWKFVYALNPMVGVIDGFRWSILGVGHAFGLVALLSTVSAAVMLFVGALFLQAVDESMADVI
jgi:lipopolysaccharide transport system permease protein